jgi:hypothetical protein
MPTIAINRAIAYSGLGEYFSSIVDSITEKTAKPTINTISSNIMLIVKFCLLTLTLL